MQIRRLVQCTVCGTKFLEGSECPKCSGMYTGVTRSLTESQNMPASRKSPTVLHSPPTSPVSPDLSDTPTLIHYQADGAVCGWLVFESGNVKGGYLRLSREKNLLCSGSNTGEDVFLGDCHSLGGVSAVILFDRVENIFWLMNGCGENAVRVNGKLLVNPVMLKKQDLLSVCGIELRFVPFCGENFKWSDFIAESRR